MTVKFKKVTIKLNDASKSVLSKAFIDMILRVSIYGSGAGILCDLLVGDAIESYRFTYPDSRHKVDEDYNKLVAVLECNEYEV